jgi:O-6-methylguanine DNA methyltransferase
MKNNFVELPVSTRDGQFTARYSEKGLAELNFPNAKPVVAPERSEGGPVRRASMRAVGASPHSALRTPQLKTWHRATESALKTILAGGEPRELPPLDLNGATDFQKSVWRELRNISSGKTRSYGEIAERIGKPKAVRAVGGACGANPIPVLIPCHRVLAANKKLGGFSGGLDWKRKLLAREGLVI